MRECLTALALIAVISRALIPTGFMPGVVDGHAQLVFCDGRGSGMAHHTHHGQAGSGSSADTPCPYALSGGAAPIPSIVNTALAHVVPTVIAPSAEQSPLPEAPRRYTAPRGPPSLG